EPAQTLPPLQFDPEGVHRAALNIVTNAIDAADGVTGGRVVVATSWDPEAAVARITIADNGVGIAEPDLGSIFQIFSSPKADRRRHDIPAVRIPLIGRPETRRLDRIGPFSVDEGRGSGSTWNSQAVLFEGRQPTFP